MCCEKLSILSMFIKVNLVLLNFFLEIVKPFEFLLSLFLYYFPQIPSTCPPYIILSICHCFLIVFDDADPIPDFINLIKI